jgi:hypothetical protein
MSASRRNAAGTHATRAVLVLGLLAGVCRADDDPKASTFHVDPGGRDDWSGTLAAPNAAGTDGPFATITRARDAVRRLRATARPVGPVVVLLHAGRYELSDPLVFGVEDSGTAESPNVYAAAPGDEGRVEISGGRLVAGWKQGRGAHAEWVADLPGVKDGWRFRFASVDGRWRDRPRLPEGEAAT